MSHRHFLTLLGLVTVGALDAALKILALKTFPTEQTANLQSVLAFAVHKNYGVAFNLPVPHLIVIPITALICLGFAYVIAKCWRSQPRRALAAAAVIIGASNNAVDRLVHGFTTDYLIFFQTSAVNLSDGLILLGIAGLLWYDRRNPSQTSH